jgi:large subunit ribosomal protein L17
VLRNLSTSLFRHERITTTLMKAKELRPFAERLITISKRETLHARRLVLRDIHDKDVVAKMFDALSSRYAQRPGGYTRIIKLGPRRGDNAEIARIELVDAEVQKKAADTPAKTEKKAKPAKGADKDAAAPKKGARTKGATPRTESKSKSKGGSAPRKVGKSGS